MGHKGLVFLVLLFFGVNTYANLTLNIRKMSLDSNNSIFDSNSSKQIDTKTSSLNSLSKALHASSDIFTRLFKDVTNKSKKKSSTEIYNKRLIELRPDIYSISNRAALESEHFFKDTVFEHLNSANDKNQKEYSGWGTLLSFNSGIKRLHGISGYTQGTSGFMFGGERTTDNLKLGASFAYASQSISQTDSSSSSHIKYLHINLYSKYKFENWYINSAIGVGKIKTKNKRSVKFLNQKLNSRYNGFIHSISSEIGYKYMLDSFLFTPSAQLSYACVQTAAFDEAINSSAAMHVSKQTSDSLQSTLSANISHLLKSEFGLIKPNIYAKWVHEYLNGGSNLHASFVQSGKSFSVEGRRNYENRGVFGGGIEISPMEKLSILLAGEKSVSSQVNTNYNMFARAKLIW